MRLSSAAATMLALGLTALHCGSDETKSGRLLTGPDAGAVSVVISASTGGTVESGPYRLEIPPGALDEDTRITLTPLDESELHPELAAFGDDSLYPVRFEPDGLTFKTPVRLLVTAPKAELVEPTADGVILRGTVTRGANGPIEAQRAGAVEDAGNGNYRLISYLEHFSDGVLEKLIQVSITSSCKTCLIGSPEQAALVIKNLAPLPCEVAIQHTVYLALGIHYPVYTARSLGVEDTTSVAIPFSCQYESLGRVSGAAAADYGDLPLDPVVLSNVNAGGVDVDCVSELPDGGADAGDSGTDGQTAPDAGPPLPKAGIYRYRRGKDDCTNGNYTVLDLFPNGAVTGSPLATGVCKNAAGTSYLAPIGSWKSEANGNVQIDFCNFSVDRSVTLVWDAAKQMWTGDDEQYNPGYKACLLQIQDGLSPGSCVPSNTCVDITGFVCNSNPVPDFTLVCSAYDCCGCTQPGDIPSWMNQPVTCY